MRKKQCEKVDSPILTDIKGLQNMCNCGRDTACKIAKLAGADVFIGRSHLVHVGKVEKFLENVNQL